MAILSCTIVCVCTVDVEVPDSKMKSSSEETLDRIMDFAVLKFENLSRDITATAGDLDVTVFDTKVVEKSDRSCGKYGWDGNYENYIWDGEKLVKEET
jgi:hypothetical protein